MKVMGNRVLVKRAEEPSLKSSVLEIVQFNENTEPSVYAMVFGVGQGRRTSRGTFLPITEVKEGDLVILKKWSGAPVTIENETLQLVDYEDVLGVVVRDSA
jgi:co-chaperonin GroES (HSP10)